MLDQQRRTAAPDSAYAWIDRAYLSYLDVHPDVGDRWLLEQTLLTGAQRRALLDDLPTPDHGRVLDVGTGFGALALDLAHSRPLDVTAVDVASDKIRAARAVARAAQTAAGQRAPGRLDFAAADIYRLPCRAGVFDCAVARLLFQHLSDPLAALREIHAALRPGGTVCVIEVDDGLSISHPESDAYRRLLAAFRELQRREGGDREVGRKLTTYLHEAGFRDVSSQVVVRSSFTYTVADDATQRFVLRRFRDCRREIVAAGLLSNAEFERLTRSLESEVSRWQFVANGVVVATGSKPD